MPRVRSASPKKINRALDQGPAPEAKAQDVTSVAPALAPAAPADGTAWKAFKAPAARPASVRVERFRSDCTNDAGITKFRWRGPGEPITFNLDTVVDGPREDVQARLLTNVDRPQSPERFTMVSMRARSPSPAAVRPEGTGRPLRFTATLPVRKVGNYRARVEISADRGRSWFRARDLAGPASARGSVQDIRFRPRAAEHEAIHECVVHVGLANCQPGTGQPMSTLADMMDGKSGGYTLEAIKDAGYNAIRLMPPFRSDPWDRRDPANDLGSPFAATDFFAVDPRLSRAAGAVDPADRERQMELANGEFKAFVARAHELGIKVFLDVALNHVGHNFIFRDLFEDERGAARVLRDCYAQLAVDEKQYAEINARLADSDVPKYAEYLFPQLFASHRDDAAGASDVTDTIPGGWRDARGSGDWQDTKQLNHGSRDWGNKMRPGPVPTRVLGWMERFIKFWAKEMGVDGFRLDHATNLPDEFFERTLNRAQAEVDKPIALAGEDFEQFMRTGEYLDVLEGGTFRDLMRAARNQDVRTFREKLEGDYFRETLRTGNHDERRFVEAFGDDLRAAQRYACLVILLGGWSTSLFADELGERHRPSFDRSGEVPPMLDKVRRGEALGPEVEGLRAAFARAGHLKTEEPALRTARRRWLAPAGGPGDNGIMAVARHADDAPDTVFLLANLAPERRENAFVLDPETRGRIAPDRWYQVRDLMSDAPGRDLWPTPRSGRELLGQRASESVRPGPDGTPRFELFTGLAPYQVQALKLCETAPPPRSSAEARTRAGKATGTPGSRPRP